MEVDHDYWTSRNQASQGAKEQQEDKAKMEEEREMHGPEFKKEMDYKLSKLPKTALGKPGSLPASPKLQAHEKEPDWK